MMAIQLFKKLFLSFFVFKFDVLKLKNEEDRTQFDNSVHKLIASIESKKKSLPSISAVYRVKNAEPFLYMSIYSIVPICSEIIIVDNNSSDNTLEIAEKIKAELKGKVEVKIYSYDQDLAIAGSNYKNELKSKGSLAEYYTYCFSKATSEYVMKCDAHLLYNPNGLLAIQSKLANKPRVLVFRGVEIFGLNLPFERYIFKNNDEYMYEDGEFYENLRFDYTLGRLEQFKSTIISPVFLHYKRIVYAKMKSSSAMVYQLYK